MKSFFKRQFSNPIRTLTLDRLAAQIDSYQNGYLAEFALTAEAMENRDDMLKNVITKRKKAVTRHGWEILVEDCSDEARQQRDALDYFYRNLTCTHALRPNERGGFQLLIYQMMDAVGKGYAVHEILWKPIIARSEWGAHAPSHVLRGASPRSSSESASNSQFKTRNSKLLQDGGANVHVSPNIAAHSSFSHLPNNGGATLRGAKRLAPTRTDVRSPDIAAHSPTSPLSQTGGANVHVSPNFAAASSAHSQIANRKSEIPSPNASFSSALSASSAVKSPFCSFPHSTIDTSILEENVTYGEPDLRRRWERNRKSTMAVPLVTAQLRFVPLWYFEATTGPLRFLTTPGALHGEPMAERDWLVTTGDALMIACSRAFLFKHYPLQAWLDFSEKFGLPGVRGITGAARGTAEFAEMEDALQTFMKELSVVTNTTEAIDVIDLKGSGQPPFPELVERMDRVMASLWRGADLSTLSRDRGYGATLQEQEARILELDDARVLSEHLNTTLDRWVLEQLFGPNVTPLARVKILVTPQECTPHDLQIDQFLIAHGARLPLSQTLERYGRVQAKPDEPALSQWGAHAPSHVTRGASPRPPPESAAHSHLPETGRASPARSAKTLNRTGVTQSPDFAAHSAIENRQSKIENPYTIMKTKLHNSTTPTSQWGAHAPSHVLRDASPRSSSESNSKLIQTGGANVPVSPNFAASSPPSSPLPPVRNPVPPPLSQSESGNHTSDLDARSAQLLRGNKFEADLGGQMSSSPSAYSAPSVVNPSPRPLCLGGELHSSLSNQSEIENRKSEIAAIQSLDDFIQLSPLGLFPHSKGFQNVDRTALETLVKNFKSFFGRLGRRFAGLPFYIRHPDVPGYENLFSDRKAYGWIMDLEVREDGLYGRTNWSAAGRELIANGHYKFLSPYWEAIRIGERNGRGVFSPTVLKSVGLTNEPNLPVLPLANTNNTDCDLGDHNACLGTSLSLFELPDNSNHGGWGAHAPSHVLRGASPRPPSENDSAAPRSSSSSPLPETSLLDTSILEENVTCGEPDSRRRWERNRTSQLPQPGGASPAQSAKTLNRTGVPQSPDIAANLSDTTSHFEFRTSHLPPAGGTRRAQSAEALNRTGVASPTDAASDNSSEWGAHAPSHVLRGVSPRSSSESVSNSQIPNSKPDAAPQERRPTDDPVSHAEHSSFEIRNSTLPPSSSAPSASSAVNSSLDNSQFAIRHSKLPPSPSPSSFSNQSEIENRQSTIEACLASCQRDIALLQERLVTTLLDNAIAGARILPIERPHWENALHENFEETSAALANAAPKLNLTSRTESLPRVNAPLPPDQKQKRILTLVHERMRTTNSTFHQAWIETRSENPSLF